MHSTSAAQVVSTAEEFILFVIVISLSFLLMSVFLVVVVINIYRQRVKSQKKLLDAIYSTQENERNRIAEDLHDSVGANLSAMKLSLDAIREDASDKATSEMAADSMHLLDGIIADLRNIIRNQTSQYLLANGFVSELMRFKNYFTAHNKIKMEISISEPLPDLNNNFGINLFRIIQELVNNSVKHSRCNEIDIGISSHGSVLNLEYKDDGTGFDAHTVKEKGMGLANIDARTKLFSGKYILNSAPGKETVYSFEFDYIVPKAAKTNG